MINKEREKIAKVKSFALRLNDKIKVPIMTLDSIFTFGYHKGRKLNEVLLTEDPRDIHYYLKEVYFTLDNEAFTLYEKKLNELLDAMVWLS